MNQIAIKSDKKYIATLKIVNLPVTPCTNNIYHHDKWRRRAGDIRYPTPRVKNQGILHRLDEQTSSGPRKQHLEIQGGKSSHLPILTRTSVYKLRTDSKYITHNPGLD